MDTVKRMELLAKPDVNSAVDQLRDVLRSSLPVGSFAEREEALLAIGEEAMRRTLVAELQAISDGFGSRLLVDGKEYKLHASGTVTYWSLSGGLPIERSTYRPVGVHNGATVVPLELEAAMVEGATPAMAYNVANGYALHDMRVHGELLVAAHRQPPPRATLERAAKRIATSVGAAVPRIEPLVRQAEQLPEGAHGIVIGLDRGAAPMAEQRPANAPAKPKRKRRKPRVRRAPAPVDVNYRMAYAGTVSVVDANGEALITRRYATVADDDPAELVKRMTADVRTALRKNPKLVVGLMQDGAPEMWNVTRQGLAALQREGALDRWVEGIDRYHLLERLGHALEITDHDAGLRRRLLDEWNEQLDLHDSAIDSIDRYFFDRYRALPGEKQEKLWEHLVFLSNNKDRLRYVTLAVAGLPCGSGVTESAVKTVIGQRAKNSGQRWSVPGLRGVLMLRAVHHSDRLPQFWKYFSRRYAATIEAA